MEHIAAFLLFIGCSEDLAQCRELPAPEPVFETLQDCEAEVPDSFGKFANAHPQMFAQCFEVDPELAEMDAEIVWEITDNGHLTASVEPIRDEEVVVASSRDHADQSVITQR